MQAKPWFKSKTVWGAILAIVSSACQLLGIDLTGIDLGPETADRILTALSLAGGLIAFFGRVFAWGKIYFGRRNHPPGGGGPILPSAATNFALMATAGALLLLCTTGCARGPVYTGSAVARIGTDVEVLAAQAMQAYADYKEGNADFLWALSKGANAYAQFVQDSADVRALVKAWTGDTGDSQKLADKLARIFAASPAPAEAKAAAIADAAVAVASNTAP